jgi:hypothetical protein
MLNCGILGGGSIVFEGSDGRVKPISGLQGKMVLGAVM